MTGSRFPGKRGRDEIQAAESSAKRVCGGAADTSTSQYKFSTEEYTIPQLFRMERDELRQWVLRMGEARSKNWKHGNLISFLWASSVDKLRDAAKEKQGRSMLLYLSSLSQAALRQNMEWHDLSSTSSTKGAMIETLLRKLVCSDFVTGRRISRPLTLEEQMAYNKMQRIVGFAGAVPTTTSASPSRAQTTPTSSKHSAPSLPSATSAAPTQNVVSSPATPKRPTAPSRAPSSPYTPSSGGQPCSTCAGIPSAHSTTVSSSATSDRPPHQSPRPGSQTIAVETSTSPSQSSSGAKRGVPQPSPGGTTIATIQHKLLPSASTLAAARATGSPSRRSNVDFHNAETVSRSTPSSLGVKCEGSSSSAKRPSMVVSPALQKATGIISLDSSDSESDSDVSVINATQQLLSGWKSSQSTRAENVSRSSLDWAGIISGIRDDVKRLPSSTKSSPVGKTQVAAPASTSSSALSSSRATSSSSSIIAAASSPVAAHPHPRLQPPLSTPTICIPRNPSVAFWLHRFSHPSSVEALLAQESTPSSATILRGSDSGRFAGLRRTLRKALEWVLTSAPSTAQLGSGSQGTGGNTWNICTRSHFVPAGFTAAYAAYVSNVNEKLIAAVVSSQRIYSIEAVASAPCLAEYVYRIIRQYADQHAPHHSQSHPIHPVDRSSQTALHATATGYTPPVPSTSETIRAHGRALAATKRDPTSSASHTPASTTTTSFRPATTRPSAPSTSAATSSPRAQVPMSPRPTTTTPSATVGGTVPSGSTEVANYSGRTRRYRSRPTQPDIQRMTRVSTHRMYLILHEPVANFQAKFAVLGAQGTAYTVTLGEQPRCSCPDFGPNRLCKHIFFVYMRVLKFPRNNPIIWQYALCSSELNEVLDAANRVSDQRLQRVMASERVAEAYQLAVSPNRKSSKKATRKPVEPTDECPICMEELGSVSTALEACTSCGNSFHADCIGRWQEVRSTCPLCRNELAGLQGSGDTPVGVVHGLGSLQDGFVPQSYDELYPDAYTYL